MFSLLNCVDLQDESRPVVQPGGDPSLQSAVPLSTSPASLLPVFSTPSAALPAVGPEADGKPADEDGESELEPMRNGAGHISETESSDSGVNPGDKESSTGASQDMEGLHLPSSFRKYIYVRFCQIFICNSCLFPHFSNSTWWCRPGRV